MHLASLIPFVGIVLGCAIPELLLDNSSTRTYQWHRHRVIPRQTPPTIPPGYVPGNPVDPASDDLWNKALCKGNALVEAMKGTDKEAAKLYGPDVESAQSKFTRYEDLKTWGYDSMSIDDYYDFDDGHPIKNALEDLGISTKKHSEGGDLYSVVWEHEIETEHDGVKYIPTNARYYILGNPIEGTIIGFGAFSPAYRGAEKTPPVTVIPPLKSWSDVTFLQWASLPSPAPIKYILRNQCQNKDTRAVIARALKNAVVKRWPGDTFGMDTEEGKAILGTPNGIGGAYLLVQHKSQLGIRVIEKVQVWLDEGKRSDRPPSLLFYVKAAE